MTDGTMEGWRRRMRGALRHWARLDSAPIGEREQTVVWENEVITEMESAWRNLERTYRERTRLTEHDDGPVTGYCVAAQVWCDECDVPFVFRGPLGMSPRQPTVSADQLTLHAPIAPETNPTMGEDGLGLSIQVVTAIPGAGEKN